jgi:hypothetical protein
MHTFTLPLAALRPFDRKSKMIDQAKVARYVKMIANGVKFTPIAVCRDGNQWAISDGFHRTSAHMDAKLRVRSK